MRQPSFLLFAPILATLASFQHVSTYTNPAVPTGTPVVGNYSGPLRPQVHFSPPKNYMNDPNGLFLDDNGTWHLYYQYDPTSVNAGNQHWGHATSPDLYHWTNQPIALFPPEKTVYVFSGSAVVDKNNTSGFFPGQTNGIVAMFTLARYLDDGAAGPETQAIAYSTDGGSSFQYYDGNPVIDRNSSQFRDPKVIWYKDHWVSVIAYAADHTIGFFSSPDLKHWTATSKFSRLGLQDGQWECPNLVKMPVRDTVGGKVVGDAYVLANSVQSGATQYFPGSFNGTHFEPFDRSARFTNFGRDNYASQFWNGVPNGKDAVNIAWASNLAYAEAVPTAQEGWRSTMTLPRTNYLTNNTRTGWTMVSELVDPSPVLDHVVNTSSWQGSKSLKLDYAAVESRALYFEVDITDLTEVEITAASALNISFSSPGGDDVLRSGVVFNGNGTFFVDRSGCKGFNQSAFTAVRSTSNAWDPTSGKWRWQGLIDRSIYEVFLDGGVHAGTVLFYPVHPLTQISIMSSGLPSAAKVSVAVWALKSVWAHAEETEDATPAAAKSGPAANGAVAPRGRFSETLHVVAWVSLWAFLLWIP